MTARDCFVRTMMFVALFGLILGPFSNPAAATLSSGGVALLTQDGMPCCPDDEPMKDCGKTCPAMTVCMAMSLHAILPALAPVIVRPAVRVVFATEDAPRARSQFGPPSRPPKA